LPFLSVRKHSRHLCWPPCSHFTSTEGKLTIRSKRAIAAVAVFLVFASPEILSIYHSTDKLRMEAKSSINLPLAIGMLARGGTPDADHWMSFGVDNNLERTGIMMRPNADVVRKAQLKIRDTAHLIVTLARRNMPNLFQELSSRWMGAPFLPALALLGAVRRPWRGPLASSRLFVLLIPITAVLATFSIIFIAARYYFILVPFLLSGRRTVWGRSNKHAGSVSFSYVGSNKYEASGP
jgi:hypothetical protein